MERTVQVFIVSWQPDKQQLQWLTVSICLTVLHSAAFIAIEQFLCARGWIPQMYWLKMNGRLPITAQSLCALWKQPDTQQFLSILYVNRSLPAARSGENGSIWRWTGEGW